jgi:hypothetical protein
VDGAVVSEGEGGEAVGEVGAVKSKSKCVSSNWNVFSDGDAGGELADNVGDKC